MKTISRRARPHTITLYNYLSTASGAASYQRTVIKRVFLDTAYQQRLAKHGVSTADTAQLIIDLRDIETTNGRPFLSPKDWQQLTDAQKATYFTFAVTNDFFVAGETAETLPETTKQQMITKYQCFSVSSANVPVSDLNGAVIIEVMGK